MVVNISKSPLETAPKITHMVAPGQTSTCCKLQREDSSSKDADISSLAVAIHRIYLHNCNLGFLFQRTANVSQMTSSAAWRAWDLARSPHRDHVYQRKKNVTGKLPSILFVM